MVGEVHPGMYTLGMVGEVHPGMYTTLGMAGIHHPGMYTSLYTLGTPCIYPTLLSAYSVSVQRGVYPGRGPGLNLEINIGKRGLPAPLGPPSC